MKKSVIAILCAAAGILSAASTLTVSAQEMDHSMHAMPASPATAAPQVHGEIRKLDTDTGKITIRHAEIPNLGMPPMTMVFHAAAPELLGKAKVGDQILFTAEKTKGVLTVTTIEADTSK